MGSALSFMSGSSFKISHTRSEQVLEITIMVNTIESIIRLISICIVYVIRLTKVSCHHLSADDELGAEPERYKQTGVYAKLHKRHIESKYSFSLREVVVDVFRGNLELFDLEVLTDKGFNDPYSSKVLLNDGVQFIVLFEHSLKYGMGVHHDRIKSESENRNYYKIDGAIFLFMLKTARKRRPS